jgi:cytoskeletal protein RodZ
MEKSPANHRVVCWVGSADGAAGAFIVSSSEFRRLCIAGGQTNKEQTMIKRAKQVLVGVAALAALGLGGSALAQAGNTTVNPTLEPTSAPDRDTVQSGDQTTPDAPAKSASVSTASKANSASSEAPGVETAPNSDGPSGPANEATGSSTASAEAPGSETPDTPGETTGSEAPNNDGPGGHADEPGNPSADHQFDGQE